MPLGIEGSTADIGHGPYLAIRSFLFESGTKPVDADVPVHAEGAGAVRYSLPVGKYRNWRGSELGEDLPATTSIAGVKMYSPLPEKGGGTPDPFGQAGQACALVSHAAHNRTDLLDALGHGRFRQSQFCFRIEAYTRGRNGVAQKMSVRGAEASVREGELEVVCAQAFEEDSYSVGSESKTTSSYR